MLTGLVRGGLARPQVLSWPMFGLCLACAHAKARTLRTRGKEEIPDGGCDGLRVVAVIAAIVAAEIVSYANHRFLPSICIGSKVEEACVCISALT